MPRPRRLFAQPCPLIHLMTSLCLDPPSVHLQWIVDTLPHQHPSEQAEYLAKDAVLTLTITSYSCYKPSYLDHWLVEREMMIKERRNSLTSERLLVHSEWTERQTKPKECQILPRPPIIQRQADSYKTGVIKSFFKIEKQNKNI